MSVISIRGPEDEAAEITAVLLLSAETIQYTFSNPLVSVNY